MSPRFTGILVAFIFTLMTGLLLLTTPIAPFIGTVLLIELGGLFAAVGDDT